MTKPVPQIFLDCDGVLADFEAGALDVFHMASHDAQQKLGAAGFWNKLRRHNGFYEHLPLIHDAKTLFHAVGHLDPIILTGVPIGNWAKPQKLAWAAKHFPGTQMITCRARDKCTYIQNPGDILVDDKTMYQHLWEDAGGRFVLHTSARHTIDQLQKLGVPVKGHA